MKALLGSSERISFCADIWTKPGMTAAFLGVIEHFYSRLDWKRHQITVAVQRFPSPHTGENVANKMYTIITLSSCVFRVITDNGSNMVAAFKETNEEGDKLDDDIVAYTIDDSDDDEAEDTDVEGEDGDNLDDIEDSQSSMSSEKQIAEYEQLERQHNAAFTGWKQISSFVHMLQLVVKLFETNPSFKVSLGKAKAMVKKFNKSCKATEKLIEKAGKKLVNDCPTRWDSTFLMISRLLDVKAHVNKVIDELGWENISTAQWKNLDTIHASLQMENVKKQICQKSSHFV